MKPRVMTLIVLLIFFLVVDYYVFQAVLTVSKDWSMSWKQVFRYGFWIPTILSVVALMAWFLGDPYRWSAAMKTWVITGLFATYFSKMFAVIVLFMEDISRGARSVLSFFSKDSATPAGGEVISRSEFLSRTALVAAAIPFGTMAYGIISGAHDYRVRRQVVKLPNLPKSFDGIKIAQLSDIHSGSFFNKTAVKGGVEMVLNEKPEKPDVIFFTGDLVNNEAAEVREYIDTFSKLKAPLGIYSITGNHDYGDYHHWASMEAKKKNFKDLIEAHRLLGFDLLMNQNRFLETGGDKIAVLGIENWGGRGFAKYGKLDLAYKGTEDAEVKLLLSHDPSHWDLQVRPLYNNIDMTFSGHTHGFQFGIEVGNFKWSPSQYAYKQWAGLYQEGSQFLYVNRGFGYLGYPGRIGMPPEITIVELKRA
jgi:predicted MPP superfamily phosphohydrolase